jgi:RnfABCDGE-type electron transport complex G subunit
MKSKIREVSVLFTIAVLSAFLLSFVYKNTKPVIDEYAAKMLNDNLLEVFPDSTVYFKTIKNDTLWHIYKGEDIVGVIFRNGKQGYSSVIRPIVSVDSMGKIIKIMIPKEGLSETPGLGMKITEDWFQEQFSGLTKDKLWLKMDNENGELDGVTAATISSRAAIDAVREGIIKYRDYIPKFMPSESMWYNEYIAQFAGVEKVEEIITEKLWKSGNKFIYLSYSEGFISEVEVLVSLRNDTILSIHVQRPEEGMEETPGYGTMAASLDFENRFNNVYMGDLNKVDAVSGATMTSDAVKDAIRFGYDEYIKERM